MTLTTLYPGNYGTILYSGHQDFQYQQYSPEILARNQMFHVASCCFADVDCTSMTVGPLILLPQALSPSPCHEALLSLRAVGAPVVVRHGPFDI